jgi:RIP metalloprotease RseP
VTDIIETPADPAQAALARIPDPTPDGAEGSSKLPALIGLVALVGVIVYSTGWWGLFIVGGLVGSVVLHEFGHYLTAKQAGMKVTEFFVGFGPKLFSFTRGETEYGLKPLPLGAYVRIIGMNDLEDIEPGDEGRTYREKSYWARLRVVLAGPATNLVLAFVLLMVVFMGFGVSSDKDWKVASIVPRSAAAQAGLHKGDHLISVDGHPVGNFSTTFTQTVQRRAGHPVNLVVDRNGRRLTLTPTVGWQLDTAGAAKLDPIQAGDKIVSVNGVKVQDYTQTRQQLADAPKGNARVVFERNGYTYATTVPAPVSLPAKGATGFLGISSVPRTVHLGPIQAVTTSGSTFGSIVTGSVGSLGHFFSPTGLSNYTRYVLTNKVPPTATAANPDPAPIVAVSPHAPSPSASPAAAMASPANNRLMSIIGVLRLGSEAAGAGGLAAVLMLLVLINVFLGLLNLVPLPPFDGGHAAVATYEVIRERLSGRPYRADAAKLIPLTYAVLVLVGFIFVSTAYLDLLHPIQNPYGK